MAILIEQESQMSSQSFDKKIDDHAQQLMLNILQRDQYRFPQRSAVREIACNAVDALNEREVAKSILTGASKVEDHYEVVNTDGLFKNSVFDPAYYDLKFLSDKNEVHILYYNNGDRMDEIVIRDFGVGLWGTRLEGYFNLGLKPLYL
jgi:hypothetical protein